MPDALRPAKIIARHVSAAAKIEVVHGSDWNDSLQIRECGVDMDLTDSVVEIVVRPTFGDTILLAALSSVTGDILFDDAVHGKFQIYWPGWKVTTIPAGAWVFAMRVVKAGEARELARGPFIVYAAEYLG